MNKPKEFQKKDSDTKSIEAENSDLETDSLLTGKKQFEELEADCSSLVSTEKRYQEIQTILNTLHEELSSLKEIVEKRLHYDKSKEEAFDYLYAELSAFKKNSAFEQVRPLYIDLILLFDRIESNISQVSSSLKSVSTSCELLETLKDELLEILYRQGIELIKINSSSFDRSTQRAIGIESTSVEAENNQITTVIRKGFKYQNHILRAEEVIIKKFQK